MPSPASFHDTCSKNAGLLKMLKVFSRNGGTTGLAGARGAARLRARPLAREFFGLVLVPLLTLDGVPMKLVVAATTSMGTGCGCWSCSAAPGCTTMPASTAAAAAATTKAEFGTVGGEAAGAAADGLVANSELMVPAR